MIFTSRKLWLWKLYWQINWVQPITYLTIQLISSKSAIEHQEAPGKHVSIFWDHSVVFISRVFYPMQKPWIFVLITYTSTTHNERLCCIVLQSKKLVLKWLGIILKHKIEYTNDLCTIHVSFRAAPNVPA